MSVNIKLSGEELPDILNELPSSEVINNEVKRQIANFISIKHHAAF